MRGRTKRRGPERLISGKPLGCRTCSRRPAKTDEMFDAEFPVDHCDVGQNQHRMKHPWDQEKHYI